MSYSKYPYDGTQGIDLRECTVEILKGEQLLVFPGMNEAGVDYVRFVKNQAPYPELLCYIYNDWVDAPQEVMGAIMGAILNGANKKTD